MASTRAEVLQNLGPTHAVQFYENGEYLCRVVADFIRVGLDAHQPALLIASSAHAACARAFLSELGHHAGELQAARRLVILDAEEMLSGFMDDRMPVREEFHRTVGQVVDRLQREHAGVTIRAYGEMVDLLCQGGKHDAAVRVEDLWTELAAKYSLSLLCGYSMSHFARQDQRSQLQSVCSRHAHVIPTERYMEVETETGRLRAVARLQQEARALEAELEHRKHLEKALRRALDDRERAEQGRESILAREQMARAEAESAGRLKDEFLSVLSHEMRTPLNAILGWAQIVNSPASDPSLVRRGLEVIQRNAASQLHLVEDLLDVSQIVTGKMVVRTETIGIDDVVARAVETVRAAAGAKDIDLALRIDPHLRPILGDRDRLQQIVWNLLSNAIKFTPPFGHVNVQVMQQGDQAWVVVRDSGQGITPEFLPHVFDRFRQADPGSTRVHGGLGLGLAVVRYLVEAHGGTVSASSDGHGEGATFTISLPTRPDRRAPGSESRSKSNAAV